MGFAGDQLESSWVAFNSGVIVDNEHLTKRRLETPAEIARVFVLGAELTLEVAPCQGQRVPQPRHAVGHPGVHVHGQWGLPQGEERSQVDRYRVAGQMLEEPGAQRKFGLPSARVTRHPGIPPQGSVVGEVQSVVFPSPLACEEAADIRAEQALALVAKPTDGPVSSTRWRDFEPSEECP